jgi:hypothetical protein
MPIIPGARVTEIISDAQMFSSLITLFRGEATDGQVARFFPVVQTAIDRGDPAAYAPHVLADRLTGDTGPQLLMQMAIDDQIVPNSTNIYFARALGLPLVGDALLPIDGVPHQPSLPTQDNLDATHSAGVFQFDVIEGGQPATHINLAPSQVATHQTFEFLRSYREEGVARIVDPYRDLGIKK